MSFWILAGITIAVIVAIIFFIAKRAKKRDISNELYISNEPSKTIALPKHLLTLLTEGELPEKIFNLAGYTVYATNKRLLRLEGRNIRDFDYNHISSIEYQSKRYWWLIVLGMLIGVTAYFAAVQMKGDEAKFVIIGGIILAIIFVILGIFLKSEWVETSVVGLKQPVKYSGHRDELDSLLKIIREKRANENPTFKKLNSGDFADKLRKLAELRDEGILTKEEFDEKKSKILQDFNKT